MALKIKFDSAHVPCKPTFVLATRGGKRLGAIPAKHIRAKGLLTSFSEIYFSVYKNENGMQHHLWNKLKNFKLVYCKEWDTWFDIRVEIDESDNLVKNITGKSLGESELSNIKIYGVEINTEADISRDDYVVTILHNSTNSKGSLLDRILEKAPHYKIGHVDERIAKIQRTFSFNGVSIYDALQEISNEINCIFIIDSGCDENGNIKRIINAYDMCSCCMDCGERFTVFDACPECGSTRISSGYGNDTSIFVSTNNLAEEIQYSSDENSSKNCFRLVAGDELMNATIRNCNPNGSGYIWHITNELKEDMSGELVAKLEEYDQRYKYYQTDHIAPLQTGLIEQYNTLVRKYKPYGSDLQYIPGSIIGFPALMNAYYNTIDLGLFLKSKLMPNIDLSSITARSEASKLTSSSLSPTSFKNVSSLSSATASNQILSRAKTMVNSNYQVRIDSGVLRDLTWTGNFVVTNYSDSEDTYTTGDISVSINDSSEGYLTQSLEKELDLNSDDSTNIVSLFKMSDSQFKNELKKYCLSRLVSFFDACHACLNILIDQGVPDKGNAINGLTDLYQSIYMNYYNKATYISDEIKIRESEIETVLGKFDENGGLIADGLQTIIEKERVQIQNALDFEQFLGSDLWLEFIAYRREDEYQNSNYISDGLDNSQLFEKALAFINAARSEIIQASSINHSISATLYNLLTMTEFESLVDQFELGNWIRVRADDAIYKLRLSEYEIDFDDLSNLNVTFSDVKKTSDIVTIEKIINKASSVSNTFPSVSNQANQGKESNSQIKQWESDGLDLSDVKIYDRYGKQNITIDSTGISCKEYLPSSEKYDDKQLKIINRGVYLTDDNWLTSRAGFGDFTFYNPETGETEEGYGVTADNVVCNYILSEKAGIYNKKNSIVMDENGLIITTDGSSSDSNSMALTIQKKKADGQLDKIMHVDSNGDLVLNGTIRINTSKDPDVSSIDDLADKDRITDEANRVVQEEITNINKTIDERCNDVLEEANHQLNEYKADVGQYMQFDEEGLTLGAESSQFKTVIDNQRMAFKDGDETISYISNSQLYIKSAVIQSILNLGNYFFVVKPDGGFRIVWRNSG